MRRYLILLVFLILPTAAPAQIDWSQAETVTVTLSSFAFTPETIELDHGRPYRLHFVNGSDGGHNFAARDFFEAAELGPGAAEMLDRGRIELDGGQSADIYVMLAEPGEYEVHCSHFMHTTFGMSGDIVVR
ncbi:cupredoxin domain-containing protein [Parasphingopyxis marina]|uniref:Cupredoxin domain-containing protein n=1 Tax=Parasphingopyxis marina TaxID=2761622 RepID=A0A842I013_9SPHN|nr:cupredoxin domain-containing protein [Parasphingopyxis marina]MBC2777969.1 cupredoxin domain-containing protein [Parasphingopyxis marina]